MKRIDMEAQLKSRSRVLPKTVGGTIGVLPINTRKPITSTSSSTTSSSTSVSKSSIPHRLPPNSTASGARKITAPTRASSNTSYRSLASSQSSRSQTSVADADGSEADYVASGDLDGGFIDGHRVEKLGSARTSARYATYAGSSRGKKASGPAAVPATKADADSGERKTFSAAVLLEMCQEVDFYKVYEINLHGTEITHIPDLEKFRKLRIADLSGNYVQKIEKLEFAQDVRDLKLYDNRISTVEGLNSLKELVNLQLQHNNIQTLGKGFNGLKKLKWLRLDSNRLTKLETNELVSCVCLTTLDLSNNNLSNLSALSYLPNLEELFLSGNRLQKLTDLQRCKKLQEVDLSRNLLSDLSGISGLPALQILDVSENKLKSLSSLGKLKSLEDLNVSFNQIALLSSLPLCFPKLQILNICDNIVKSWIEVCELNALPDLVEVFFAGNPFTLEDGECPAYHMEIQSALPSVEIVDGAHVKRAGSKGGAAVAAPLMRPMSVSSVISVRQVDAQLRSAMLEQQGLQRSIADRFASLKSVFETLPANPPPSMLLSARSSVERPSSVDPISRETSSVSPPSSSRCSRRSRIRDAQAFASSVIGNKD